MLEYKTHGRCEWCGDRLVDGDDVSTARKGGRTVIYHEVCQGNDIGELDPEYQDAIEALMFW